LKKLEFPQPGAAWVQDMFSNILHRKKITKNKIAQQSMLLEKKVNKFLESLELLPQILSENRISYWLKHKNIMYP
jgi:hypothetical protein